MWYRRICYLLILFGMTAFFFNYDGWIAWYLLLLTLCLPILSLLLSLPRMLRLRIGAEVPEQATRGEDAAARLTLQSGHGAGEVRLRLVLRDCYGDTTRRIRQTLKKESPLEIPLPTEHCGVIRLELRSARVTDLLGLFSWSVRRQKSVELLVMPKASCARPPDFSPFRATSFRPKPGGGYSEYYELRDYRPGDPVHAIHWKLSAKRDALIVREAEEVLRQRAVVSFSLTPNRAEMDSTLDALRYVTEKLLSLGERPLLCYREESGGIRAESVASSQAFVEYLTRLLRQPVKKAVPLDPRRFRQAEWHCHITPEKGEEAAG